ncbi:MAG: hypothetical protein COS19_03975 [Flavobacteriaceae bacterium CG02_land_8_20_14_3_00_34_13]|nr:MAG: hypothetical protein COS19_03975 [Flavobacteriaceae bacterium CG02_land_8_20_14_3_00_34_13]
MTTEDKYNFISYDELFNAIENDLTENKFKTSAEFLMSAVTDWPTLNLQEPKDLIAELKSEIKEKLTFDNLEGYLKNLKPNTDAWKMEAVTALLEMFDFDRINNDRSIDLEIIVDKLTQHYRQK